MIVLMVVVIMVAVVMGMIVAMSVVVFMGMLMALFAWFENGWFFAWLSASATITHGILVLIGPVKDNKNCAEGMAGRSLLFA